MGDDEGPRRHQVLGDLLLVAAVPLGLAVVHVLVPPGLQGGYVLAPDAPTLTTLFTAAFLHVSDAHLAANAVGYLLGALSAYLLCLLLAERRWFRLSAVVLVLGLPALVNWTSVRVLRFLYPGISAPIRGFSGVAAGFGGFALAALLAYVGRRTDRRSALFSGLAVALVLLWEVLVIYADGVPPASTVLVVVGVALCLAMVGRCRWRPETRAEWLRAGRDWGLSLWTVLVLSVLVAGLFPADVVDDGRFTNIFAHAIGFGFGFVVSGWGYRYWRTTYP